MATGTKLGHELFRYVMMLLCTVAAVGMIFARQWFLVPIWMFNGWMWYRMWRNVRRQRALEVLRKLREAAWRTPSSS